MSLYNQNVNITNITPIPVDLKRTEVKIKSTDTLNIRQVGGRWWAIAIIALVISFDIAGIYNEMKKSNTLKEEELKIRKEQLDLARRQFQLDSVSMTQNQKIR